MNRLIFVMTTCALTLIIPVNAYSYQIIKETSKYTKLKCDSGVEKLIWPSDNGDGWCVKNFGWKCGYSQSKAAELTCHE